ncbi:MAG: LysE family transporter [Chloroflexota bacterium]
MTLIGLLIESISIGFAIAAPVGPIGILCIRRTLERGLPHGLISGLGAATADAVYGSIIAFGLTALSTFLLNSGSVLNIVGGLFLLYIGINTLRASVDLTATTEETISTNTLFKAYTSTFVLTITNPLTILTFVGIFAGLGELTSGGSLNAIVIVLGVFLGSTLWWLLLSGSVNLFRSRVTAGAMGWVNRFSGIIITLFALRILLDIWL